LVCFGAGFVVTMKVFGSGGLAVLETACAHGFKLITGDLWLDKIPEHMVPLLEINIRHHLQHLQLDFPLSKHQAGHHR